VPLVYNRFGFAWQRWLGLVGTLGVPVICVGIVLLSITPAERLRITAFRERERLDEVLELLRKGPVRTYNNYGVKMLNAEHPQAFFKDTEGIAEARQAFAEGQVQLKEADRLLQQLDFVTADMKKRLQTTKEYVAAWSRFFSSFRIILDRGTPWSSGERKELIQAQQKGVRLHEELFR
jgi:hypothetical protein